MADDDGGRPALEPYVPTPEELVGESWMYCYGQPVVFGPPPETDGTS